MNSTRRDFFKVAGAAAAVGALASRDALAHAPKPKPGNNPIWLMTSAFPGDDFDGVVKRALEVGAQGLELCVFRRDSDRTDHVATHLDYKNFTPENMLDASPSASMISARSTMYTWPIAKRMMAHAT